MSEMDSEECKEYQRNHANCAGCPYEFECAEKARHAIETAEKIAELLRPYLEES